MTFPTIPTVAAGRVLFANQADTSGTRTFPDLSGLTKNSGDLLIAIVVTYQSSTNPQFSGWGGGFTEWADNGTSSTLGIGCAYKWSDGTETGTFTVTQAVTIAGHASMCLLSIPGAHASTPPECGTIANGTSAAADPGSFNPAGWGAEDTLWIALAASGMTSGTGSWTATGTTAPASYGNRADSNTTDNSTIGQTEIAVAFRELNASAEDVGTAGVDTSNARNSALVIAVRPAAAPVHDATGAIAAQSATMTGTAKRFLPHATSGALTAQSSTITGTAQRLNTKTTTGALFAGSASMAGTATVVHVHATSGVLAAQSATMTGTATRTPGTVEHVASGVLAAQSATMAGAALHFALHAASGAIAADPAVITGTALRFRPHVTSGALAADSATMAGTATVVRIHATSGALVAQSATMAGAAINESGTPPGGSILPFRRRRWR